MRFLLIVVSIVILNISSAFAGTPILNFSDITSGPKTGNTDGVGSGVIVTIWGCNLGSTQGTSKVYVGGVEATVIYYWKNADGTLPGGPADLYTYHKMQEISFSIPSGAADGANTIKVTVGGTDSNTLPFTVRAGGIKFVKSTGNDSTGTGTWTNPYLTLNNVFAGGNGKLDAGDTVYSVGVGSTSGLKVGGDAQVAGTAAAPISLIAYPNTSVAISGTAGSQAVVENWYPSNRNNAYVNYSKFKVTAYGNDDQSNAISVIPYNRIIGLEITGPTVYGGYGGAITGTGGVPQGGAYLGIYIHHYGYPTAYSYVENSDTWTSPPYNGVGAACTNCTSVDRFQHLYYISNRVNVAAEAYEIGWNHLTDNPILAGIHIYDQGTDSAGWSGVMRIHDNVIKNQRGSAIDSAFASYGSPTVMEIYNNLIIVDANEPYNHGPAFSLQGNATQKIYNNTVYGYSTQNIIRPTSSDYRNNLMVDTRGVSFIYDTPTSHSNNLFYSTGTTDQPSWATSESGHTTGNPLFTDAVNYDFSLQSNSPALAAGYDTTSVAPSDFLGNLRSSSPAIGAIDALGAASPIPGSCGPSNGLSLSSAPVTGLCTAGTPSAVSGTGPWSWTCAGSGGGSTASCGATLLEIPSGVASAAVACSAIAGFR